MPGPSPSGYPGPGYNDEAPLGLKGNCRFERETPSPAAAGEGEGGEGSYSVRFVPQFVQNFAPAALTVLHFGQVTVPV